MKFGKCFSRFKNKTTCWLKSSAQCGKSAGERMVSTIRVFTKRLRCAAHQFHWISYELPLLRRVLKCLVHLGMSGLVCFRNFISENATVEFPQAISKGLIGSVPGCASSASGETACPLNVSRS